MVLVFFIFLIFIIIGLFFSKVSIDVCNLKLDNNLEKINAEFLIKLKLNLYGFIPFIVIKLNEFGIKIFGIKISYSRIFSSEFIRKILKREVSKVKTNFKISSIKVLKPDLENINLNLHLGTESFLLTTILVFLASTILSFSLKNTIKKFDKEKYKYIIKPDFEEKNKLFLEMKGIFKIRTTNIIECVKLYNL
ncbi:MAG: hypothetical protein J6J60_01535 [Clostridia bacterium]|nr:hypothetical protein [Clostridia bacterium]